MSIDHYGPGAAREDRSGGPLPRELVTFDLLAEHLPNGGSLLDVGCAEGFTIAAIHRRRHDVRTIGIDRSPWQLQQARDAVPWAPLIRADVGAGLPLADASIDVVYAAEILEHVHDPDRLLVECRRVLRTGGHLVVSTPNLAAWFNRVLLLAGIQPVFVESSTRSAHVGAGPTRRFRESEATVGHVRILTLRALTDLLRSSGFDVEQVRSAPFERLGRVLGRVDAALGRARPGLGSMLIVVARASGRTAG